MTNYPKISIVTPSFNQGRFIEKTILSVIEQDYPNLEYIIIDGGSTDESVEIIKKYEKHLAYWVSEPDRGQSHAINKGFELATGEIFGWLNSDDWYHDGALKAVSDAFASNPDAGAVVGSGDMVDENGESIRFKEAFDVSREELYNWHYNFFWQPSCFFTRNAWEESGRLDENIHYAMDLDLWFRISSHFRFAKTSAFLSSSQQHTEAKTTAFDYLLAVDVAFVVVKYGGELFARKGLERYLNDLLKMLDERWTVMQQMEEMIRERDAYIKSLEKKVEESFNYSQLLRIIKHKIGKMLN